MKKKSTAGILAILLGGVGVHKFYLDRMARGFVYLLLCWTFIPAILGLIEGIIYLSMSEDSFNRKHNHNFSNKERSKGKIDALKTYNFLLKKTLISKEQFQMIKSQISSGNQKVISTSDKINDYAELYLDGALNNEEREKILKQIIN